MEGFEASLDAISARGLAEDAVHATLVLALGMMLAEFNRTQFADPEEEEALQKPDHVTATPLDLPHSDTLTAAVAHIW